MMVAQNPHFVYCHKHGTQYSDSCVLNQCPVCMREEMNWKVEEDGQVGSPFPEQGPRHLPDE
jgi:hypothetical protein